MDLNHESVYFTLLSGGNFDDSLYTTGYENVTKEQILEIFQTYFEVDFGYDVKKWKKYIEANGGWFYHYWENDELSKIEDIVLSK